MEINIPFELAQSFLKRVFRWRKSVFTPTSIAMPIMGSRYNYGNMFYVQLVTQHFVTTVWWYGTSHHGRSTEIWGWRYVYVRIISFDCSGLNNNGRMESELTYHEPAQQQPWCIFSIIPLIGAMLAIWSFFSLLPITLASYTMLGYTWQ